MPLKYAKCNDRHTGYPTCSVKMEHFTNTINKVIHVHYQNTHIYRSLWILLKLDLLVSSFSFYIHMNVDKIH